MLLFASLFITQHVHRTFICVGYFYFCNAKNICQVYYIYQ